MSRAPVKKLIPMALSLLAFSATSGLAAKVDVQSKFTLSYLGLSVGKMKNSVVIDGNNYRISGSARTQKIAALISKSKAEYSSRGEISGTRIIPAHHSLTYKSNKKSGTVKISFANGNVVSAIVMPKKKIKRDTVPVLPNHLTSVLDPLSTLLFPVLPHEIGNGKKICDRTLPVFGGRARLNLVFSYRSTAKAWVKGFRGKAYTCSVRYQPVSGHRPNKKGVKFLQSNRNMQVTMVRIGNTNLYGLFSFKVKTDKGTVSGYATKFASRYR